MRLPEIILAGTAALTLPLNLGAYSLSVNGSGSKDSGSSIAWSKQRDIQGADSKDSSKTGAKGVTTTDSQSSSGGSAQAVVAPGNKDDDKDNDKDSDGVPITDPAWKNIQSTGQHTEVSGTYTVQGAGTILSLIGDLDTLTVQGSDVKISAEDVDTLTVRGSSVTVCARDTGHFSIQGSNITVHWPDDDPTTRDGGANNAAGKLSR